MKKQFVIFSIALLSGFLAFPATVPVTPSLYTLATTSDESALATNAGIATINDATKGTPKEQWYFYSQGVDHEAHVFIHNLPSDHSPVVLYGISLGGVLARLMAQVGAENGKNVVGNIAQSSPLEGDRMANHVWCTPALASLTAYLLAFPATLPSIICSMSCKGDTSTSRAGLIYGGLNQVALSRLTGPSLDFANVLLLG